jgi:hypothetical protein
VDQGLEWHRGGVPVFQADRIMAIGDGDPMQNNYHFAINT